MSDSEAHNPPAGCVLHPGETEGALTVGAAPFGRATRDGSPLDRPIGQRHAHLLHRCAPQKTTCAAGAACAQPRRAHPPLPNRTGHPQRVPWPASASSPAPGSPTSTRGSTRSPRHPLHRRSATEAGGRGARAEPRAPPKGALLFFSREDGARRQRRYRGEGSRSGPSERRISPPEACTGRARAPPRRGSSSRAPTRRRGIPRVQGKHPTHRARTCARAAPHPEPSRLLERPDHPPRARGGHRGAPRARQAARRRRAHEVARRARRMARCVPHAAPRAPHGGAVVSMWPSGQRGVGGRARGARRWRLTDAVRRGLNP